MSSAPQTKPRTTVFFQDKCLSHRYIRSHDTSMIFERPQRLRAVKIGVAAAIARLEDFNREKNAKAIPRGSPNDNDVLSTALEHLSLAETPGGLQSAIEVVMSTASVDILNHPAVEFVHGSGMDGDGDGYLQRLVTLVRESEEKIARDESEIPEDLSQGDLYLSGQSLDAIQGAIGTVCEAVDVVFEAAVYLPSEAARHVPSEGPCRAFAAIRPPGHHCGEDTPCGFCFTNNVAIGAAHAHLKHGVSRVVILDIDLHHGNGTQSIVWDINKQGYRRKLDAEELGTSGPSPLQVYYGSIHDPLSYPCEDGNAAVLQAASVSLHGPHGQHIENVHLLPYQSEEDFWDRLYSGPYRRLLEKAEAFLEDTAASGEAIVFISAGFDASEHETASMSRHGRKLPTSFFKRFTRDVRTLADKYARGRIVSVLEGGYSDRALCSGAMAHVLGLAEEDAEVDESWWSNENLAQIEKTTKKRRGARPSATIAERWLERTLSLLAQFDPNASPPPSPKHVPPSTMILRDRSKKANGMSPSSSGSSQSLSGVEAGTDKGGRQNAAAIRATEDERVNEELPSSEEAPAAPAAKKLPRVLLRVNAPLGSEQPPREGM